MLRPATRASLFLFPIGAVATAAFGERPPHGAELISVQVDKARVRKYLTSQGRPDMESCAVMKTLHCSFCGKSEKQIERLAAGPGGIHICNECVEACLLIMDGAGAGMKRRFDPRTWPTERLLA